VADRISYVRMRPTPRRPRFNFHRRNVYRGGTSTATGFRFSWETAAERWRCVVAELGVWRVTVKLRSLGPGPGHA
jgi:hypothetical protein